MSDIYIKNQYTLNDYKEEKSKFKKFDEHKDALVKCVASTLDGYIIKTRDEFDVSYIQIKRSKANDYFGFNLSYKSEKIVEISCTKFIKSIEDDLVKFDGIKIMGSNPRFLNLYRPPNGKYLEGIPEKIISFFESRVYNPTALHEELSAHAYRLRHPNAFIEKCFIHYSPNYGNCGKSLLAAILSKMYGKFSNVAVQQQQLTSRFTGWAHDLLMLHVEELQNTNYRNHDFETIIKQITTRNGSGERKGIDTKASEHHAIVGFNTNQKDLYGLIRADEATISRLVILFFKPNNNINWEKFKTEIGLNDKINTDEDAYNLGYTLYYYLKHKYEIKHNFTPCRYYEQEKYDLINELRKENKNSIDSWLNELKYKDEEDFSNEEIIPHEYKLLEHKKIRGIEYTCIKNVKRDINASYSYHIKNFCNSNNSFKIENVISALQEKGFSAIKSSGVNWLRIETEAFNKLVDQNENIEEVIFDD